METKVWLIVGMVCYLYTDPTYKEWKPGVGVMGDGLSVAHGSYLQGMET